MIEADPNRSYVVDVFEAGSNQKVRFKHHCPRSYGSDHGWHRSGNRQGKKIHEGQGKVRECYLESGKLRIWRKVRENWNKLTQLLNTIEGWPEETFGVTVILTIFCLVKKEHFCWKLIRLNERVGRTTEPASRSDILYIFGQGNQFYLDQGKVREFWKVMCMASAYCNFISMD